MGEITKMINYKRIKYIYLFIGILISDFLLLRFHGLVNQDQFFCFGFANAIFNGYVPYNDFNMIIFPLYAYLMAPFSKNILTFHIFNAILQAGIYSHITYLIKNNKVKVLFILFILLKITLFPFLDYNILMIYFLIISYFFLEKYLNSQNKYFLLLTGMFLSMALLTKHSVPGIIIIALTIMMFIHCTKNKKLVDFIFYSIGGSFPVVLLLFFAHINNYLFNMIDYALLSMLDFSSLASEQPISLIFIISILFVISVSLLLLVTIDTKNAIKCLIYIVPIFVLLILKEERTALFSSLYILSILGIELESEKTNFQTLFGRLMKYITGIILIFMIFCLSVASIKEQTKVLNSDFITTNEYDSLKNTKMLTFQYNYIRAIEKYIKDHPEEDILVVSAMNRLYGISQNETYGVFDILLSGNLGIYNKNDIPNRLNKYDLIISARVGMKMKYEPIYDYIKNTYEQIDKIPIENGYAYVYKVK